MRHFPLERCGTRGAICDPQGHRTSPRSYGRLHSPFSVLLYNDIFRPVLMVFMFQINRPHRNLGTAPNCHYGHYFHIDKPQAWQLLASIFLGVDFVD